MARDRPTLAVAFGAALVTLSVCGAAQASTVKQYVLRHPKHEHCKAHYVKKIETVKKREHGRAVKLRETVCVYVKPKAAATMPASTPTAPAPTVSLKARLDSVEQSPANPFAVTYIYSASATETLSGITKPAPTLPQGVLDLYADGLLACSINVGASTASGECPVRESMGAHTIIVTYTSGAASATETTVQQIEPFATAATSTTLQVTDEGCTVTATPLIEGTNTTCVYTMAVSFDEPDGPVPSGEVTRHFSGAGKVSDVSGEHEATLATSFRMASGSSSCAVTMETTKYAPHAAAINKSTISGSPGCPGAFYDDGNSERYVAVTSWTIVAQGAAGGGFGEGGGGWLPSESSPQAVTG